ncbi:MAG: hypothetical protein HC917_28475 [Richelia sp. SM2_1_7]|nr:hypothetical protein [Richelia sp. SM2_1_7]
MPIIGESLQELLDDSFNRLTEKEKLILHHIADQAEPVGLEQIISTSVKLSNHNFELSATELFKIIYSLRNRFLDRSDRSTNPNFFHDRSVD